MAYLIIASTFLVGWWITSLVMNREPWPFRAAASWAVGVVVMGWLVFMAVAASNFQVGIWGSLGLVLAFGLARFFWRRDEKSFSVAEFYRPLTFHYILYSCFWLVLLSWLFATRMLPVINGMWYSGGGSWADLAMHAGFISSFSQQQTLSLQSLIYSQESTTYPFMINFYTALLVRGGWSMHASLVATGLSLAVASTQILYWLCFKLTKKSASAWIASLLIFVNGGGGVWFFWQDWHVSQLPLWSFLARLTEGYTIDADRNLQWANLITTHLLPQRGFMATLPIFFLCLWLWNEHFSQLKSRKNGLLWLSAGLIGLLPGWYVHTHLMLVGLFGGTAVWSLATKKENLKNWFGPSLLLFVLAAPQWWWLLTQSGGHQSPHVYFGWMAKQEGIFWFWLKNLGLGIIWWPATLAWASVHYKKHPYLTCLAWLFSACFILCNLIIFQAYDWNNLKFMLLAWAGISIVFASMIAQYWSKLSIKVATLLVVIALTASGWLSLLGESHSSFPLANPHEIALAELVKQQTPVSAIFLTSYHHNHPIQMIAGRPVVLGYLGWLWTHGIDYSATEFDVREIYAGSPQADELLKKHHVSYVVIGTWERSVYVVNQPFFEANYPAVIKLDDTTIYQVH